MLCVYLHYRMRSTFLETADEMHGPKVDWRSMPTYTSPRGVWRQSQASASFETRFGHADLQLTVEQVQEAHLPKMQSRKRKRNLVQAIEADGDSKTPIQVASKGSHIEVASLENEVTTVEASATVKTQVRATEMGAVLDEYDEEQGDTNMKGRKRPKLVEDDEAPKSSRPCKFCRSRQRHCTKELNGCQMCERHGQTCDYGASADQCANLAPTRCDNCRSVHTHCTKEVNGCVRCNKKGLKCIYTAPRAGKR
ncbi:hypothetical protein LTS15_004805 [Exophiala xenobiotica]|nr:hypothetical protein LTS15_004805 [Exophiala xenobiotica]